MTAQVKKIYRSEKNKIIAGVCGGLAEYFEIDPIIFRILFVVLTLLNQGGVLLYLVLIFIIPSEAKQTSKDTKQDTQNMIQKIKINKSGVGSRKNLIAVIIIAIGLFSLFHQIYPISWIDVKTIGPLIIILIGLFIISKK